MWASISELERSVVGFEGSVAQKRLRCLREYKHECPVKHVRKLLELWRRNLDAFLEEEW